MVGMFISAVFAIVAIYLAHLAGAGYVVLRQNKAPPLANIVRSVSSLLMAFAAIYMASGAGWP